MSESAVVTETLELLARCGVRAIRMHAGDIWTGKRIIKRAPPGTPDILCKHPYAWIELKSPEGAHRNQDTIEAQRKFREQCQRDGVPHIETDDPREAVTFVLTHGWTKRAPAGRGGPHHVSEALAGVLGGLRVKR